MSRQTIFPLHVSKANLCNLFHCEIHFTLLIMNNSFLVYDENEQFYSTFVAGPEVLWQAKSFIKIKRKLNLFKRFIVFHIHVYKLCKNRCLLL